MNKPEAALAIIDEQRGFMPAAEGERLGVDGFGELTVPGGHLVVPNSNRLTEAFLERDLPVVTTQDSHKLGTAHFAEVPDYLKTWPVHCVEGTPGAELHPDLIAADDPRVLHFTKGDEVADTPAEDDSYTGALAHAADPETNEEMLLPDFLRKHRVAIVYVIGLALGNGNEDEYPLCVDSTAIDLHEQGFEVAVITDAVEAVAAENREICFRNLGDLGIRLLTTDQALAEIKSAGEA